MGLAQEIRAHLPDPFDGRALLIGPLPLARELLEHLPALLVVNDRLRRAKLAKQVRQAGGLPVVRATPHALPLGAGCLDAVLVADTVARLPLLDDALECWSQLLRPDGLLVLAEKLSTGRRGSSLLTRRRRVLPEDLTGCLLNVGFTGIGQVVGESGRVITRGRRLLLPDG